MQHQGERPCAAVRICDDENQIAREPVGPVERIPLGSTETCSPVFLQVDCQHLLEVIFDTCWEACIFIYMNNELLTMAYLRVHCCNLYSQLCRKIFSNIL